MGRVRRSRSGAHTGIVAGSPLTQAGLLLVAGVVVGGGGVAASLPNLAVQLLAIGMLAVNFDRVRRFFVAAPVSVAILAALSLLLPLAQLIPLPPVLWHALPGRAIVTEALALVGQDQAWRPVSLATARTFVAFLGLLAPFTMLMLMCAIDGADRRRLMYLLVALAAVQLALGGLQVIDGSGAFQFHIAHGDDTLTGTFANRNSTAVFLVVCQCILVGLALSRRESEPPALVCCVIGALLVLATFLTQSRSGAVLQLVPAAFLMLRLPVAGRLRAGGFVLLLALVIGAGMASTRLSATFARFDDLADARPHIWEDAHQTLGRYWPAGSGMGTFDEVFQLDESLEYLDSKTAGRAHNDYLELAIEAGPFALALVLAWAVTILTGWWRRRGEPGGRMLEAALGGLAILAAQSVLDYPLRNQALLCVAALLVGMVCFSLPGKPERRVQQ